MDLLLFFTCFAPKKHFKANVIVKISLQKITILTSDTMYATGNRSNVVLSGVDTDDTVVQNWKNSTIVNVYKCLRYSVQKIPPNNFTFF